MATDRRTDGRRHYLKSPLRGGVSAALKTVLEPDSTEFYLFFFVCRHVMTIRNAVNNVSAGTLREENLR